VNTALQDVALLADAHRAAVLRRAYFHVRDRSTAEDLSQEVFLRAVRHWSGVRDKTRPAAWLMTVTANVARDHHRSPQRRLVPVGDELVEPVGTDVADVVIANDPDGVVADAVRRLSPPLRDVIVLRYYEDLDISSIAARLGVHPGTVRTRLHRATAVLRRRLASSTAEVAA
jgi:RNA polymerase sigma-70 factor, ECF subfamily